MEVRSYTELRKLATFRERYEYLKLSGRVGEATFGFDRYLNQRFYMLKRWRETRDIVIVRDEGCDLGVEDYEIYDKIIVHHMNPVTLKDIEEAADWLFDPEFLVCTSHNTHLAIHYSDEKLLPAEPIIRRANDTTPWR